MFVSLNLRHQVPLPGAAEDDITLVVNRSRRIIESRSLKRSVIKVRRVGNDANAGVLDCGSRLRVEYDDAEMHSADLRLVRLYRDDDFVGAGGSAVELQRRVEGVGAFAGRLPHDEYAQQNQGYNSKEQSGFTLSRVIRAGRWVGD